MYKGATVAGRIDVETVSQSENRTDPMHTADQEQPQTDLS